MAERTTSLAYGALCGDVVQVAQGFRAQQHVAQEGGQGERGRRWAIRQ